VKSRSKYDGGVSGEGGVEDLRVSNPRMRRIDDAKEEALIPISPRSEKRGIETAPPPRIRAKRKRLSKMRVRPVLPAREGREKEKET